MLFLRRHSCRWNDAVQYYSRAISLAPSFSFAVANRALAMYQLGRSNEAIKEYRTLLRRWVAGGGGMA
jgi:tetratricopeptide (TPR) repeat protein